MQLDSKTLDSLEQIFEIRPEQTENFKKALIHGSYTKENNIDSLENYERLEFLGDAVLKLCVSEILYKKFPNYLEGNLTKIRSIVVSDNMLAQIAREVGLSKLIILGKQEEKMGGRDKTSILACALEAILGAYHLEGKSKEISYFLEKALAPYIKDVDENSEKFNAKAILQEYTQSQNRETPNYIIVDEIGPQHNKTFVVEVSYMQELLATGKGKTKKEAEQAGAYEACLKLGILNAET